MRRAETRFMPGYMKSEPRTVEQIPPMTMQLGGHDTLIAHVPLSGSALIGRNGGDLDRVMHGQDAEIALIVGTPGHVGLLATLDSDGARALAQSLTALADIVEGAAARAAAGALEKAQHRGKGADT